MSWFGVGLFEGEGLFSDVGVGDESECDAGVEGFGEAVPHQFPSAGCSIVSRPVAVLIVKDLKIIPEILRVPAILLSEEGVEGAVICVQMIDSARVAAELLDGFFGHAAPYGAAVAGFQRHGVEAGVSAPSLSPPSGIGEVELEGFDYDVGLCFHRVSLLGVGVGH